MTGLLELDVQLFHWINGSWSNPLFDYIVPYWRHKLLWIPLYVFILSFMIINFRNRAFLMCVGILLTTTLSDVSSSHIIKKSVERLRPCNTPDIRKDMTLRVRCGTGYSFTSSHATNHFAVAWIVIFLLGKRWKWIKSPMLLWAGTISLGQVYVGVHFPLDILCGAMLGYFCALLAYRMYLYLERHFGSKLTY